MSLPPDSPANPSQSPENVRGQMTPETCGLKPFALYKQSDPNMSFSKMCQDSSPPDPTLAYVAGLIDGEGCIGIQSSKAGRQYYAEVTIGMVIKARPLLGEIQKHFGGTVVRGRKPSAKWAASLKWRIGGDSALEFLEKIGPYLMLKRQQLEQALALRQIYQGAAQHPNGSRKWTKQMRAQGAEIKKKMHRLNQTGPDAPLAGAGFYRPDETLFGTLEPFSGRWPKQGMTQDGVCSELTTLALPTIERGSGYWATPTRMDGILPPKGSDARRREIARAGKTTNETEESWRKRQQSGAVLTPPLTLAVKMWPTPRAADGSHGGRVTPRKSREGGNLIEAVSADMFPTPKSRDWKGVSQRGIHAPMDALPNQNRGDGKPIGGSLNPEWVEWLMGVPIGATDLKPLEICKFQEWKQQQCIF